MVVSSGIFLLDSFNLLLDRAHRKILHTIMGLPVRCRVFAIFWLLGACSFASLICQRQLSFIHSFSLMSTDALPRHVLALCLANHGSSSVLHTWSQLLRCHSLPDIAEILTSSTSVYGWCCYIHSHLVAESHAVVSNECSHLPLGHCLVPGRPIPHWGITLSSVVAIRHSFLCIQLLVGCGGLMDDLGHFHGASSSASPLCHHVCEDALHFIAVCPYLHSAYLTFLASAPPSIFLLLMILRFRSCVMWFSDFVGCLIFPYRCSYLAFFTFFGSSVL